MPEGAPFCPSCGAPQIRVVTPQATEPPPLPPQGDVPLPPLPTAYAPAVAAPGVQWSAAIRSCLLAAAVLTFLYTVIGVPLAVMIIIPAGGWFAVYLYSRGKGGRPVNAGIGARIGAVTGLLAYALYGLIMAVVMVFQRGRLLEEVRNAMRQAAAQNPNPQAQQIVEKMMTPEGIAILVTISAIFLFFIFLVLCSIGGAIGGSLAKKNP